MSPLRIIGIDPGFDRLGVAIIEKTGHHEQLIFSSCITSSKKETLPKRLYTIAESLQKIIQTHTPQELAIETLFITKNQKTVIAVAEIKGVCLYLAHMYGLSVHEYSPPQIKLSVGGHGKASKEDVAGMVSRILHIPTKDSIDDEVDAIAIALTHSAHRNNKLIYQGF